ncbi:MAG: esterase-like activity of phytase family protein [Phycisphaerae bacterium]
MGCTVAMLLVLAANPGTPTSSCAASRPTTTPATVGITYYRLRTTDGQRDVQQCSGLHFGRLDRREGLWMTSDRNGGPSAGRILFISAATLAAAEHQGAIKVDERFTIIPPAGGWEAFASSHSEIPAEILDDLHDRVEAGLAGKQGPYLDLEAITIAPSSLPPHAPHLFAVAEEPYSTILEVVPLAHGPDAQAQILSVHIYEEAEDEQGSDRNDGLEAFAWAGQPGLFYWAEEGTSYHGGHPGPRLFFRDPKVGRGRLVQGRLDIEQGLTNKLTSAVWTLREGSEQTLNSLTVLPSGRLLAVDRNGGWILRLDPQAGTAERWLNLYDINGLDLRKLLHDFPAPRRMPYISIEGISIDRSGDIWLVDDPALPEAFRASCLIRLSGLNPDTVRQPQKNNERHGPSQSNPER